MAHDDRRDVVSVSTGWTGWSRRLAALERRYFPIDGGGGAALFAQLPGADDRLRRADSPRHADLLVVAGPVSKTLLPAVAEAYADMPTPRELALVLANAGDDTLAFPESVRLANHLRTDYVHVDARDVDVAALAATIANGVTRAPSARDGPRPDTMGLPSPEETLVALRPAGEREIATEDVIVSIGPIQRVTAGPLQLLVTADGEQIVRAEVRSGFAVRGVEPVLGATSWSRGAHVAESLDPIAPITGRLAYVTAVEALYGIEPPSHAAECRDLALRTERAASHLGWLTRFADLLAYDALTTDVRTLYALALHEVPNSLGIVPGGWDAAMSGPDPDPERLRVLAVQVGRLARRLRADRLFARRTRGVGIVSAERARAAGASGPVLEASEGSRGDALARADTRLRAAESDLERASVVAAELRTATSVGERSAAHRLIRGTPPGGSATSCVIGPRGVVSLFLESRGDEHPARVRWTRPSHAHLGLVADLVVGCTLPNALTAVASLDLSMAEADG